MMVSKKTADDLTSAFLTLKQIRDTYLIATLTSKENQQDRIELVEQLNPIIKQLEDLLTKIKVRE